MFERFRRGWAMAKASWAVLRSKPTLLAFPVISGIALILVTVVFAVPVVLGAAAGYGLNLSDNTMKVLGGVALFVWYFLCTFVIVFCNSALIGCALQSFDGHQPSVGSGFAAARRRVPQILGWSLLAATVGVVLRALQSFLGNKFGFLGELAQGIVDAVWGVLTYFVVPVVVTEGVGPIEAVKRSASILRRTWGESLSGSAGLGAIMFLFLLPLVGVGALLAAVGGGATVASAIGITAIAYVLLLSVVFSVLNSIFRAAVYRYAVTGSSPAHMDPDLLRSAFSSR